MDAQRRSGLADASSGDEADTRELAQLNEQIKHLKAQMLAKGNELSKRPPKSKSASNEAFINTTNTTTTTTTNISPACTGPVYLPVHHLQRNRSLSPATAQNLFVEGSFKAEPVQVCLSGESNYFQHQTPHSSRNYFAVDKANAKNLHCSPDRRYKSSVEIPAEHLETLKAQNNKINEAHHQRSRSLSSSSFVSSESMVITKEEHHHHHHHQQQQQRISSRKTVYVNSSSSGSEKQRQHDLLAAKEVESLRQLLAERNTIIERQKLENELHKQQLFYLNENKINDLQSNQNLLAQLESQQALIISMKMKLNEKTAEIKQQEQQNDAQPQVQKHKTGNENVMKKNGNLD